MDARTRTRTILRDNYRTSYISTRASPVSPLAPETCAVYAPGGKVTTIAESAVAELPQENAPTEAAVAAIWAAPARVAFEQRGSPVAVALVELELRVRQHPGKPKRRQRRTRCPDEHGLRRRAADHKTRY